RATTFPPEQEDVVVRLVALAICELVLTSRMDPAFDRDRDRGPAAVAEVPRAPVAPPPAAAPAGEGPYILFFGQAVGPFAGAGVGWGGGLRLGWASRWRWLEGAWGSGGPVGDLEIGAAGNTVGRPLGSVDVSLWSATL